MIMWRNSLSVLEEFLVSFGGIPCQFWRNSLSVLEEFLVSFGGIPCQFWRNSLSVLEEFLVSFGGIPCQFCEHRHEGCMAMAIILDQAAMWTQNILHNLFPTVLVPKQA